jgi:hypothetical protein
MKKLLLLLVVLAAAFWYFKPHETFFAPAQEEYGAPAEIDEADFLVYEDALDGFTIEYPVGYYAQSDPGEYGVAWRAYATIPARIIPQSFEVRLTNEPASMQGVEGAEEVRVGGETVYSYSQQVEFDFEDFGSDAAIAETFVFDCGDYSALVTAVTPASASFEFATADYVLHSFKC